MKKNKPQVEEKVSVTRLDRMKFWGAVALIVIILGYGYSYTQEVLDNRPAVVVQTGEQLFDQNCASCHGPAGIGQDVQRPKGGILPDDSYLAPALNGTGHTWHHKTEDLFNTIKFGSMEPTSAMKGFEERLSDEEISKIIEYFKSLWSPEIMEMYKQR